MKRIDDWDRMDSDLDSEHTSDEEQGTDSEKGEEDSSSDWDRSEKYDIEDDIFIDKNERLRQNIINGTNCNNGSQKERYEITSQTRTRRGGSHGNQFSEASYHDEVASPLTRFVFGFCGICTFVFTCFTVFNFLKFLYFPMKPQREENCIIRFTTFYFRHLF